MKSLKIKPLGERVVIQPMHEDEKTKSGIVLPDTAEKEKPEKGKIVAVGSGRMLKNGSRVPLEVKKGDIVLFTKYGPTEIKIDGKELLIASREDVLAILE